MSVPLRAAQAETLREEARALVARACDHERRLGALVDATATHVRQSEAALSTSFDQAHNCLDDLQHLLRTQMLLSRDEAAVIRTLSAEAHDQSIAAVRLLAHLERVARANDEPDERRPVPNGVIVADDYREVREVIATVLRNAGFVVTTAANGLDALLAAYEMRPAVILMDVSMPVLDGLEATRLIKAADATRHARVIAYTGDPIADDAPVRTLFAAVLQKPIAPAVVVETIQQIASL